MSTRLLFTLLFPMLLPGCEAPTEGQGCPVTGAEGCPCSDAGLCLGDLSCASNVCVDLGAMSTTGADSSASSNSSTSGNSSTTSTSSTSTSSTSSTTAPPTKPDLGGGGCSPGEYGCSCDCSDGVVCVCDSPFVCDPIDGCVAEGCLEQYEPCQWGNDSCCDGGQCLGLEEQDDFACVKPCLTDADCPVTCCVNTSFDELFCAPSIYYCP